MIISVFIILKVKGWALLLYFRDEDNMTGDLRVLPGMDLHCWLNASPLPVSIPSALCLERPPLKGVENICHAQTVIVPLLLALANARAKRCVTNSVSAPTILFVYIYTLILRREYEKNMPPVAIWVSGER